MVRVVRVVASGAAKKKADAGKNELKVASPKSPVKKTGSAASSDHDGNHHHGDHHHHHGDHRGHHRPGSPDRPGSGSTASPVSGRPGQIGLAPAECRTEQPTTPGSGRPHSAASGFSRGASTESSSSAERIGGDGGEIIYDEHYDDGYEVSEESYDSIEAETPVHSTPKDRNERALAAVEYKRMLKIPTARNIVLMDYKVAHYVIQSEWGADLAHAMDSGLQKKGRTSTLSVVTEGNNTIMAGSEDDKRKEPNKIKLLRRTGLLNLYIESVTTRRVYMEEVQNPELHAFVTSTKFEASVGLLIMLNSITLGLDMQMPADQERPVIMTVCDNLFICLFLVEITLRIKVYSLWWIFEPLNLFDVFVVLVTGVLSNWVLPLFTVPPDWLQRLAVLRIFRLFRMIQLVRTVPAFLELWHLVQGVQACLYLLFWALIITSAMQFVFAVYFVDSIGKEEMFIDDDIMQDWFGTLRGTMFSLFVIMTFDGWAGVMRPVMFNIPDAALVFLLYMGVCGILLNNLITAIVCSKAFDTAKADIELNMRMAEMEEQRFRDQLTAIFQEGDQDGSGDLTRAEFMACLDDIRFVSRMKILEIDVDQVPEIFDILDDGDGNCTTEEFVGGIHKLQGPAMSKDLLLAAKGMRSSTRKMDDVGDVLAKQVSETLPAAIEEFNNVSADIESLQCMTVDILELFDTIGARMVHDRSALSRPPGYHPLPNDTEMRFSDQEVDKQRQKMQWEREAVRRDYSKMDPIPPSWSRKRIEEKKRSKVIGLVKKRSNDEDEQESIDSDAGRYQNTYLKAMRIDQDELCRVGIADSRPNSPNRPSSAPSLQRANSAGSSGSRPQSATRTTPLSAQRKASLRIAAVGEIKPGHLQLSQSFMLPKASASEVAEAHRLLLDTQLQTQKDVLAGGIAPPTSLPPALQLSEAPWFSTHSQFQRESPVLPSFPFVPDMEQLEAPVPRGMPPKMELEPRCREKALRLGMSSGPTSRNWRKPASRPGSRPNSAGSSVTLV